MYLLGVQIQNMKMDFKISTLGIMLGNEYHHHQDGRLILKTISIFLIWTPNTYFISIARFLALVTTMVTKVDHGNYGWLPRLVTMVSYLGYQGANYGYWQCCQNFFPFAHDFCDFLA